MNRIFLSMPVVQYYRIHLLITYMQDRWIEWNHTIPPSPKPQKRNKNWFKKKICTQLNLSPMRWTIEWSERSAFLQTTMCLCLCYCFSLSVSPSTRQNRPAIHGSLFRDFSVVPCNTLASSRIHRRIPAMPYESWEYDFRFSANNIAPNMSALTIGNSSLSNNDCGPFVVKCSSDIISDLISGFTSDITWLTNDAAWQI